jgi:hypothetical protein
MDFVSAWKFNPLGFPVIVLIIVTPVLLVYDLLRGQRLFYLLYVRMEMFLKNHRLVSTGLVLLVVVNWIFLVLKEVNI